MRSKTMSRKTKAPTQTPETNGAPETAPKPQGKKTNCPVTREHFRNTAKAVTVRIGDLSALVATPKEFSTNSIGWFANGKVVIEVGGVPCTVQVGLNLTIVGSKELPK
jgi:hypothetical protein